MITNLHETARQTAAALHNTSTLAPVNLEVHMKAARDLQFITTYIATAEQLATEHETSGKEIERLKAELAALQLKQLEKQGVPS